jgi:digeranylgeranylglycerophospholipid reductase
MIFQRQAYDVIVVGGGPAGSSTSFHLADLGKKVLVVEKDREVGRNVLCAEGISRGFYEIVKPERGIASEIKKIRILVEDEVDFTVLSKSSFGYILERKIFDRLLFERAVEKGAVPLINSQFFDLKKEGNYYRVFVNRGGQILEFLSQYVVGADGPGSGVGLKAGMRAELRQGFTHYCSQVYLYDKSIEEDRIVFYYSEALTPGGYGWVFPKKKGFANVGVGVDTSWDSAEAGLKLFLEKYFPNGKILGALRGVVPWGGMDEVLYKDGVFLVGDAGRLADPMSGGGIANAYLSGKIAAESIATDSPESYPESLKKVLGRDYYISTTVKKVFYSLKRGELVEIFKDLKRSLDGQYLEDINAVSALKMVLGISPRIFGILVSHGGSKLNEFVRKIIS